MIESPNSARTIGATLLSEAKKLYPGALHFQAAPVISSKSAPIARPRINHHRRVPSAVLVGECARSPAMTKAYHKSPGRWPAVLPASVSEVMISLKGGTGVPPVNHAQDARATSKLSHYGVRTLIDFSFRAEYRRPVQDERLTSHEPDRFAHSLIQPRIRSVVIQQLTRWTSR